MKWRKYALKSPGYDWYWDTEKPKGYAPEVGPEIPLDAINKELSTREHVPNKQEAKAIRKEKAKLQRTK